MFTWLATTLIDSGWVKTGLFFRWIIGTDNLMYALSNEKDLATIKRRYQLMEQSGFFSGQEEISNKQAFIKSLFAYNTYEGDAYSKALERFYSWNGSNLNPLKNLLDFIRTTFFQGDHAAELKQTFIEATFDQNNGESNTLAHTAWAATKSTKVEENPLALLLDTLDEAGCFKGPKAEENQNLFLNAITKPNKDGVNALCQSLNHINFDSKLKSLAEKIPNFHLLLERVQSTLCLEQGTYAQKHKELLSKGLLHRGKLRSVLSHVMLVPEAVAYIFKLIDHNGYFSTAKNRQNFFDVIVGVNKLNCSILYYASNNAKSLQLIRKQLKALGCFDSPEAAANKEQLIKALIRQDSDGRSALSEARDTKVIDLQLQLLEEAGCFSGPNSARYKQLFIDAVLSEDKYGNNVFSRTYSPKAIILLLQKLTEAGCLNSEINKRAFIKAVKNDGNTMLFHCVKNPKTYIALRQALSAAGLNAQDLKDLLNQSVNDKYGIRGNESPFMAALKHLDAVVIELLKRDGAELTEEQAKSNKDRIFKPKLKRSTSFSELTSGITLFDKTNKEADRTKDDSVLFEKSSWSFN